MQFNPFGKNNWLFNYFSKFFYHENKCNRAENYHIKSINMIVENVFYFKKKFDYNDNNIYVLDRE